MASDESDLTAEIARARGRAAETSGVRRESRPDPTALPPLPASPLEGPPPTRERVGDHIPDEFLKVPSDSFAVWEDIWQRDVSFRFASHRTGLAGRLIVWLKRALGRFVRAPLSDQLQRQRIFNIVIGQHLERQMFEIRKHLRAIREPYSFVRDLAVPDLISRGDALYGVVDRRIDAIEAELQRLRDETVRLAASMPAGTAVAAPSALPPRGEPAAVASSAVTLPPAAPSAPPAAPSVGGDAAEDGAYYSFEALHRGSEEEIRERQAIYPPIFAGRRRVVDLGCGRGEMLALFKEAGIGAYGVDQNVAMVARCRRAGLEVVQDDAIRHLAALPDGSLDGAFSAQVFEHWERDVVVAVVKLLRRKLAAGAPFVMETQNPVSLVVGASGFWRDFTHVRPIHPDAFEFLVGAIGFGAVEVRPLAPFPPAARLPRVAVLDGLPVGTRVVVEEVNRSIDAIDQILHGYRDYAVVCYRS